MRSAIQRLRPPQRAFVVAAIQEIDER